jgi:excisionase family DNA binding protein
MPTITFSITDEDVDRIAKRFAIKLTEELKAVLNVNPNRAEAPLPIPTQAVKKAPADPVGRHKSYLTIGDVSEMLQFSPRTVWRLIGGGDFPHHRIGRTVRFREEEIEEWLEKQNRRRN